MAVFFGTLVLATLVGVAIAINVGAKRRRDAFAVLAQRLGLMFSAYRDPEMAKRFAFLNKLAQGSNRYAFNTLWGNFRQHAIYAFDYHYETYSRDSEGNARPMTIIFRA